MKLPLFLHTTIIYEEGSYILIARHGKRYSDPIDEARLAKLLLRYLRAPDEQ